jgi:hypothetical protein
MGNGVIFIIITPHDSEHPSRYLFDAFNEQEVGMTAVALVDTPVS